MSWADLPLSCVEKIYDELHVHDRLRMNMALPCAQRVTRTIKTDTANDRHLAVAWVAMKKRSSKKLSRPIKALLTRNSGDPTVRAMVAELGVPTSEFELEVLKKKPFVNAAEIDECNMTEKDAAAFVEELLRTCTVEQFVELATRGGPVVRRIAISADAMFTVLNFRNLPLFEWIAKNGADVGFDVHAGTSLIVHGSGKGLLTYKDKRDLIVRHLPLDEAQRAALLDAMLDDLDADSYRALVSKTPLQF